MQASCTPNMKVSTQILRPINFFHLANQTGGILHSPYPYTRWILIEYTCEWPLPNGSKIQMVPKLDHPFTFFTKTVLMPVLNSPDFRNLWWSDCILDAFWTSLLMQHLYWKPFFTSSFSLAVSEQPKVSVVCHSMKKNLQIWFLKKLKCKNSKHFGPTNQNLAKGKSY